MSFARVLPVTESHQPLTVSQLTARIKDSLQTQFSSVWVAGEISNLSRPQSGHVYLTLKDEVAQLRAVLWRATAARVPFELYDGLEVVCDGEIDVYPPRGSYQLIIRRIQPRGEGALQLALRQLRERLAAEGLFDPAHKKPLPGIPRRIAIVTSPTGAALRDFLEVARRRWRGVDILVIPARVQGEEAADEIVAGIRAANSLAHPPEVLIVARGGGSLEDLWSFNEERVVRAIFASRVPVVSAVGHEIDVTLSDLVADVRALTPSEAAERVVPSMDEIAARLRHLGQQLVTLLRGRVSQARARLTAVAQRRPLRRPRDRILDLTRTLDELEVRSRRATRRNRDRAADRLRALAGRLESLSPLAVLARGYSITQRERDAVVVREIDQLNVGDRILSRLARGRVLSRVERLDSDAWKSP